MAKYKLPKDAEKDQKLIEKATKNAQSFKLVDKAQPTRVCRYSSLTKKIGITDFAPLYVQGQRSGDDAIRAEIIRMVTQLPSAKLEKAAEFLRTLMAPDLSNVVPATDDEVKAAADAFIRQYKVALERLAK